METAYYGESFEQPFTMYDARDKTKKVDSATFIVTVGDETVQSGALALDEDGHTGSFRFIAEHLGVHTIVITWRIGNDVWKMPFLMNVVSA